MKIELVPYLLLTLFALVFILFSGCGNQRVEGIEVIQNYREIGLERIKWSPVNPDELLVTASSSNFNGESEVYLLNVNSEAVQEITKSNRGDVLGENWSFNGDQVILLATKDTEGYEDGGLWLWDKNSAGIEKLLCCEGVSSTAFVDQVKFVFSSVNGAIKEFADFFLFDIETGEETVITKNFAKGYVYDISYSPIRNEIVFALWNDDFSTIYILELEDNSASKILGDRNKIDYPTWSPNGEVIAFTEPTLGGLSLRFIDPDSGCETDMPETFKAIFGLTWSPDSQKIAFINEDDEILIIDLLEVFETDIFDSTFLCE